MKISLVTLMISIGMFINSDGIVKFCRGIDACAHVDNAIASGRLAIQNQFALSTKYYARGDWRHWSDFDGDCINTRHEILIAQARGAIKRSPDGCYVSMGKWVDPYSGKIFTRASELDIDHVVPLHWAHKHGGAGWSLKQKERFANDGRNLLAVDKGLNRAKGDKGPDEWMPPLFSYRCAYVKRWEVMLKAYPELKMNASGQRIFSKQISACSAAAR